MKRKLYILLISALFLTSCGGIEKNVDPSKSNVEVFISDEKSESPSSEVNRRTEEERQALEASQKAEEEKQALEASQKAEEERQASEASQKAEEEKMAAEKAAHAEEMIGSYITFGHYEQDLNSDNGAEPMEWLVLAHDGEKMLLISRYLIDMIPFNEIQGADTSWEVCSLRTWLNQEFLDLAFTLDEKTMILDTTNETSDSYDFWASNYITEHWGNGYSSWGAKGNGPTTEKIFLLSTEEALAYFDSDESRKCIPTLYMISKVYEPGDPRYAEGDAWFWWLRSPGGGQVACGSVEKNGFLSSSTASSPYGGVRPAMWVKDDTF